MLAIQADFLEHIAQVSQFIAYSCFKIACKMGLYYFFYPKEHKRRYFEECGQPNSWR